MGTPYKMKGPSLYSSPMKQKEFNEYTKTNAAGNRVDMMGNEHTAKARANKNAIGAPKKKGNVGYKPQAKTPKAFNTKGGKSTTPGYNTTKGANKGLPKSFNTTGASKAGKFAEVATKTGGKEILKKIIPAAVIVSTLHDFYKSGQKHSGGKVNKKQKSFMADAKKSTKSIWKK